MLRNYLIVSFRNLRKSKVYGLLNIFGLTIGITCAALIFLWVEDELNFDHFNLKKERLYYIRENQKYDAYVATFGSTPALMAPALLAEIPGIANTCRLTGAGQVLISIGNRTMYSGGVYVDPSLFSMFTFPFVEGNARAPFSQRYSIVITESAAKKFFGNETNAVGKTVRLDNKQDYFISGVIKDIPTNSSVQFEWAAPIQVWLAQNTWSSDWGGNCLNTYVELSPGINSHSIDQKMKGFIQKRSPHSNAEPFLWTMNDWHLRDDFDNGVQTGNGQIEYVHLFTVIAWIILLIACINFMNLATARSERRAREVGVRKVLGAGRKSLIFQFIGEALFMSFLSALLALVLLALLLPAFNLLVQKQLTLGIWVFSHWGALLAITALCGIVAGSYPSLYLSSFNPSLVLKGLRFNMGGASFIRKGLVILQFSISIFLIISTIVIYQQIEHVKNRNLGFNKSNLLQVDMNSEMDKNYTAVSQDLLQTGVVDKIAVSDYNTLFGGNNSNGFTWKGKPVNSDVLISQRNVSPGYFSTSGMKLLAGRDLNYTDSASVNKKQNIVITESLEKLMGKGTAVGKIITAEHDTSNFQWEVVGVVNDYMYGDMYGKPDPVMFYSVAIPYTSNMYVRIKPSANVETALAKIADVIKKDNPSYPFTYHFVDDQFNQIFQNEELVSKLSRLFSGLAIAISCLGLFGLAAYTAERRTKEIGIRKVLGASTVGITGLLTKGFVQLVCISCLLAFPISWLMMNGWLENYKYRISISSCWWVFIAAGLLATAIALITISFQSIKAAMANPVQSLRND